jgi:CheY-like chemotaxis protein
VNPSLDPRILIVDDDPDVAELITVVLQRRGFRVEVANGGGAALERLAREPYDLIICDLVMPEVDGIAVYRAVQQRAEPPPPMLFLSGYYDAGGYEDFLRRSGVPTMPKPFEVEVLRATVLRMLGRA